MLSILWLKTKLWWRLSGFGKPLMADDLSQAKMALKQWYRREYEALDVLYKEKI